MHLENIECLVLAVSGLPDCYSCLQEDDWQAILEVKDPEGAVAALKDQVNHASLCFTLHYHRRTTQAVISGRL